MPLYCGKKNAGFKPVGNLTENNGVYSGFYAGSDLASSGYLQAAQALPNKISSFYFYTKFTWTGVSSSILSSVQDLKGLADIAIADDGTYRVWISSNGTSYDIAESFKGNYTFIAGNTYYFAFNWNGSAYQTFIKPEGAAEWTNDIYIAGTVQPYTKDSVLILGIDQTTPSAPFQGSIDANETTLYIDGRLWLVNDAVKTKDLYLGGQKIAYAFLGAKNSNCLTYIPQDIKFEIVDGTTPTLYAGSEVWVPYGTAAPELSIGDTLNSGIITSIVWDGAKLFYKVKYDTDLSIDITSDPANAEFVTSISPSHSFWWFNPTYSQDTAPSGFGQYALWYDTAENIVKITIDSGSTWQNYASLPVGVFTMAGTGATKTLKYVFNGVGYIGTTVFAVPGVKGLMADGLNENGSYKSIERTFDRFVMRSMAFDRTAFYGVVLDGEYTIQGDNYMEAAELPAAPDGYAFCYRKSDNTLWWTLNNNTWVQYHGLPIGFWTTSTGGISNFNPAQPEELTKAFMCYCSYNATQTICNLSNGQSWSGTLARGVYYVRGQGAGAWGNASGWGDGYGGGSGAGFEGYIHLREAKAVTVTAGICPDSRGDGEDTVISGVMTLGGGRIGVIGSDGDPQNGGTLTMSDDIDVLSYTVMSNGNDGIIRGGGNSVLTNSGGGDSNADATAPGAGGGGSYGIYGGGKGYYGEILIKAVGAY